MTGVVHVAGFKYAGVSVERPLHTYQQNVTGTVSLLEAMHDAGRFVVDPDPLDRANQVRLIGEVPGTGRLVTVAAEQFWEASVDPPDYRPISAWGSEPPERARWREAFE